MEYLIIKGGQKLNGTVSVSGSKNASLPIMAAAILSDKPLFLKRVPQLTDIDFMGQILRVLGGKCDFSPQGENGQNVKIHFPNIKNCTAPYELVRKMRASTLVLGSLLARFGEAKVSYPGGCTIGVRPVNLHLSGLKALGAIVDLKSGYIHAYAPKGLKGARFCFPQVSVGATENILIASVLAEGTTILENVAKEPEILDLGNCLIKMGAKISGLGTDCLIIEGVSSLKQADHEVIGDRIEMGSLLLAAATTGGDITVTKGCPEYLESLFDLFQKIGLEYEVDLDKKSCRIQSDHKNFKSVDIVTDPYPGFPTDLQAQIMAFLCTVPGTSVIRETIFESRFMHIPELLRFGANINFQNSEAVISGVKDLKGASVMATDLRASMSLIIAALKAKGESRINRIYHLDRGYEKLEKKLNYLGANIQRSSL